MNAAPLAHDSMRLTEKGAFITGDQEDDKASLPVYLPLNKYYEKYEGLRNISPKVIRNAWFTMAHLLVSSGSHLVDMGCMTGQMTYAMALMNPDIQFTGIDWNKKFINQAQKNYELPNLDFKLGTADGADNVEPGSMDGLINSYILHEIYSHSKFSERSVVDTLDAQFKLLKPEAYLYIRDYAMPPPNEYVLMEMPAKETNSKNPENMSEPELLVWYSQHARPQKNGQSTGFFMEELPPRFPNTRLFKLPYKWAYEFLMRKDHRSEIEAELAKEYTFFTQREFRKNIRQLGGRVLYTGSHWDDLIVKKNFDGHFRLYGDDGTPYGPPPTSFVAIAQKTKDGESLRINELRPSANNSQNKLVIKAVRNEHNGKLTDIITREENKTDVLPYYLDEKGTLHIYVHESTARGITNAVPRIGRRVDDKRWSGHMIEARSIDTAIIAEINRDNSKDTALFARDYLGLKPYAGSILEDGPELFPAPDFIDEMVRTRYLHVAPKNKKIPLKNVTDYNTPHEKSGHLRPICAQKLLNAIYVGYIPNARLETQIEFLFNKLQIPVQTWSDNALALSDITPEKLFDGREFISAIAKDDNRFKPVKGTAGQLRTIHSTFMDEGISDEEFTALHSNDLEFVISEESPMNRAVVLPLGRNAKTKEPMVGFEAEFMPIPQRHKGTGLTLKAPSFPLPENITHYDQARKYVAEKFGVPLDRVWRLGESYYCHTGVTPQRVFPFAIAAHGFAMNPFGGPIQFAPMSYIYWLIDHVWFWNGNIDFIRGVRTACRDLAQGSDLDLRASFDKGKWSARDYTTTSMKDMTGLTQATKTVTAKIKSDASPVTKSGSLPFASNQDNKLQVAEPKSETNKTDRKDRPELHKT